MALPAGLPASFRLEDGCLMCSATTAIQIGRNGRISTCGLPVPSPALSRLSYIPKKWRTRRELHPGGRAQAPSRRQRGALLIELRVQKWPASRSSEPEARTPSFAQRLWRASFALTRQCPRLRAKDGGVGG